MPETNYRLLSFMEIVERKLKGVYEITFKPIEDNRGSFSRIFDINFFNQAGMGNEWVQENHSKSKHKHIIRGLHLQLPPFSETKLVRCTKGAVIDVFVDLRKKSKTYGKYDSIELTESNNKMICIPRGFAHGYCTLSENSDVLYKVDNFYSPENEVGLIWNDKDLNIKWPVSNPILSNKDMKNISFIDFNKKYNGGI